MLSPYYSAAPGLSARAAQYKVFVTVGSSNADYIVDGVADEVQINQALVYVNALGGGVVYLKDTSYHISLNPIAILNKVWLRGNGRDITFIYGDSTLGTNAVMLSNGTLLAPTIAVTLSDFTIDGTSMPTSPASTFRKGIDGLYTLRWLIQNVRIYNTPATGYGLDSNVQMQLVDCIADTCGVTASNPGYNGFGFGIGFYAEESIQVVNCIAVNCLNNGFLLEYVGGGFSSRHYEFTNCYAFNNKRGFRVSGASGATFMNCKAINSTTEGFYMQLFGSTNPVPENTKIIGCDAYNNGSTGIYFKDQEYGQINIICEGNHVYSNIGDGIICGGLYAQIKNNVCWNNDNDGIFYHANSAVTIGDVQIKGNICYNNGQTGASGRSDGLRVHGELGTINSVIVEGNQCFDNQSIKTITDGAMSSVTNPTQLTSASGGWKTTDVGQPITVNGAGAAGGNLVTTIASYVSSTVVILSLPALTTVSGATVTYGLSPTQQFGLVVKDYVNDAIVTGNICHDNTKTGIFYQITVAVTAINGRITNNICYNNGKAGVATATDGIRVWGSGSGSIAGVLVQSNRCYDDQSVKTQTYGIAMKDNVTQAQIFDNDVRGNLTAGVLNNVVDDSTLYYRDNLGIDDVSTKTADYTLTSLDKVILGDTTSGTKTMTLPTAVGRTGRIFTLKKIASANTLTIATTSAQTIDGSSTVSITVNNTALAVISDNTNWRVI